MVYSEQTLGTMKDGHGQPKCFEWLQWGSKQWLRSEGSSTADLSFTLKVMKESWKDFKQGRGRTRVCFNEHTVMGQRERGGD